METKRQIPTNTITRTLSEIDTPTGNIYESVNVIARRANQISSNTKVELSRKLAEFAFSTDNLEETFENREQIEVSRHYEAMPKAALVAIDEFLNNEIEYHHKDQEVEEKAE